MAKLKLTHFINFISVTIFFFIYIELSYISKNIQMSNPHTAVYDEEFVFLEVFTKRNSIHSEVRTIINEPKLGEDNIIFIESTCARFAPESKATKHGFTLNSMQACAIESAANTNPNASVYLFYSCPLYNTSLSLSSQVVQRVFQYPNVHLWHESMESFFEGTPLEEFYKSGQKGWAFYPISDVKRVLKYLALWKYGGTYLELDFITRRSLSTLGVNFFSSESATELSSGVMRLSATGVGRDLSNAFVEQLRTNYRGYIRNENEADMINRVMRNICSTHQVSEMTEVKCKGINVLAPSTFYPISLDTINSGVAMQHIASSYAVKLQAKELRHKYSDVLRHSGHQQLEKLRQESCPVTQEYAPILENGGHLLRPSLFIIISLIHLVMV